MHPFLLVRPKKTEMVTVAPMSTQVVETGTVIIARSADAAVAPRAEVKPADPASKPVAGRYSIR